MLTTAKKAKVMKKIQKSANDTGSSLVQVGLLTARIEELSKHLKKHKKDLHSRRGLIKLVSNRRKHLKYLERNDKKSYNKVLKEYKLKG